MSDTKPKKKSQGLMEYNEKCKNGEIKRHNPHINKTRKLSVAFREMQEDAIVIIEKALAGDDSVSKAQVDAAWKVVNSIMTTERAEQDKKIRRLEEALKEKQAEVAGAIPPKNEQVKEKFQSSGLKAVKLEIPDEWEDDLDDDDN